MAKRPCARAGCPSLVEYGFCASCAPACSSKALTEQARPNAHRRGYTRRWSAYSQSRLRKYPLCVGYPRGVHGERIVAATLTDHITSAAEHPELFWDPKNHQSLCDDCNKRKAIVLEGGLARGG